MRLLFIRHAEPDYSIDSLTEKGWKEAELLSRRLAQLRQEEREARDESQRFSLHRRILDLEPLLRQCRQLHRLTAHYYDRSYYRDERFTV